MPSAGLEYSLTSDGDYYAVSGIGSCTDSKIVIPEEYNGLPVKAVGLNAFNGNKSITEVEIHEGIEYLLPYAFKNCSRLNLVSLPKSLLVIDWCAFENCVSLTDIVIPDRVTEIKYGAFRGCETLENIVIGSRVKIIGTYAFASCSSLVFVTIPSSVKSVGDKVFNNCFKLIEIKNDSRLDIECGSDTCGSIGLYSKNVYRNKGSKLTTDENGFVFYNDGENYLLIAKHGEFSENLVLPQTFNGKSYVVYQYAFQKNTHIKTVQIPDEITEIGKFAFSNCSNLESVVIGDGLLKIGEGAFYHDQKLQCISVGKHLNYLGDNVFRDCAALNQFDFGGSSSDWSGIFKGKMWNVATQITSVSCSGINVSVS